MADRQIIRDLIKKYAIVLKYGDGSILEPKIDWKTWGNYPARLEMGYIFEFEGEFVDKITTLEARVLAMHEIAHFNALNAKGSEVGYAEHGHPVNELQMYDMIKKEHIPFEEVNASIESIHRKWAQYYRR